MRSYLEGFPTRMRVIGCLLLVYQTESAIDFLWPMTCKQTWNAIYQGYGLTSSRGLAEAILKQQQRVLDWRRRMAMQSESPELRQFSADRVELIKQQMVWVEQNQGLIEV